MTRAAGRSILIATTNRGKLREIAAVMEGLPVEWIALGDLPPMPECAEDADTFEGNAEKKAHHYARLGGLWTLADDSGLEVDALGGRPGVKSARFAGEPKSDARNNARLIQLLAGVPAERRTARFRCVLALVGDGRLLARTAGTVEGVIVDEPRGTNGFGYDPHFLIPSLGRTMAELSPDSKNRISHRGQALRAMRDALLRLLA
ncbi:MAG TPA: XTP/dITP diphosphatase [Phycisphaerae bacterium]|nr:XTP/dITP diphosphatase [Phycisphaerae bacterium]